MRFFYLDTSAIVKRYRTETGSDVVNEIYDRRSFGDQLITSHFSCLEFESLASRALKGNVLSREAYNTMLGSFAKDLGRLLNVMEVDGGTLTYAIQGARAHGLRPGDAMQYGANFVEVRDSQDDAGYVFVCSDQELLRAVIPLVRVEALNPESDNAMDRLRHLRKPKKKS